MLWRSEPVLDVRIIIQYFLESLIYFGQTSSAVQGYGWKCEDSSDTCQMGIITQLKQ